MKQIVIRLIERFKNSRFWKNVAFLSGGAAISQVISVSSTPILTRVFNPEDFGLLAIYISILSFASSAVILSYNYAILPPEKDSDAANVILLCVSLAVVFSIFTIPLILIFKNAIINILGEPRIAPYLWFLPINLLFLGIFQTLNYWATRKAYFDVLAKTKLKVTFSSLITKIGLGLFQLKPMGLFIGKVVSDGIGVFSLFRSCRIKEREILSSSTLSGMKEVFFRYIRFPLFTTPTALLNAAGTNLPIMLISTYYGSEITGLFSMAQRLITIPTALIGVAIGQVYVGEITSLVHKNPKMMFPFFIKTIKRLLVMSLLPAIVFLFGGSYIVPFLLGKEWQVAGVYLQYLSISFIASFIAAPVSGVFSVLEKQDIAFIWNIARLFLVFVSFFVAFQMDLSAKWAILCYAISILFIDIWRIFLVSHILRKDYC